MKCIFIHNMPFENCSPGVHFPVAGRIMCREKYSVVKAFAPGGR
ncbi:hypothetical protein HMPREF1548_06425 [Clostridium sp. KLE 1755]|nr:hypothetical protein HMPREF1548_06425 [Clostridium sp. KLE 1755]